MNKDKQFKKVNELYNGMCCLLAYNNKKLLNNIIDEIKIELKNNFNLYVIPLTTLVLIHYFIIYKHYTTNFDILK